MPKSTKSVASITEGDPPPTTATADMPAWLQPLLLHQQSLLQASQEREERLLAQQQQLLTHLADTSSAGSTAPRTQPTARYAAPTPPPPLTSTTTVPEFVTWKAQWDDYVRLGNLSAFPREDQLARLRSCLSPDMRDALIYSMDVTMETTDDVEQVLQKIGKHFRSKQNLIIDRVQFINCRQQPSERFDDFLVRVKKTAFNADLCHHCCDDQVSTVLTAGITAVDTRIKLMKLRPSPGLQQVIDVCRSEEAALHNTATLETASQVHTLAKLSVPDSPKPMPASTRAAKVPPGSCYGCGGPTRHVDRKDCPAYNSTCSHCNKKGHFASICFRRQNVTPTTPSTGPVKTSRITLQSINNAFPSSRAGTIAVQVSLVHAGHASIAINCQPDTGADISAANWHILDNLNIAHANISPLDPSLQLFSANNTLIRCSGSIRVKFAYHGHTTTDTVYICDDVQLPLLSFATCKALQLLSPQWPLPCNIQTVSATTDPSTSTGPPPGSLSPGPHLQPADDVLASLPNPLPDSPSPSEVESIKQTLLTQFFDVFSTEGELKCMTGEAPMKIHLREDAQPFCLHSARKVPFAFRDKTHAALTKMVTQGVIAPIGDEPAIWTHPMVVIPKPNGDVRICVDLTKLNRNVQRQTYPMPSLKDAISNYSTDDQYFSTVDATHGYWQIPLDDDCQSLTTFITPWGRYKFLRAPMGFVGAGDEYNRRGDKAIAGFVKADKVVDDILARETTFPAHVHQLISILNRCRLHGITLNPKKFHFAQPEVKFVGYLIGRKGIKADPDKIKAICDFPCPSNLTELRSFLGMANQFRDFSRELSAETAPLRSLLSKKNTFTWTPNHDAAFQAIKTALSSPPVLAPFQSDKPLVLQTDASRRNGLGYALLQKDDDDHLQLIQAGSRFISETEGRYAMVELELLGVVWAVTKCQHYLLGQPHFQIIIDHKPLLPFLNHYTLDQIDNPRLQRLREKLMRFTFSAEWRPGADHMIPDALSRAPTTDPTPADEEAEDQLPHHLLRVSLHQLTGGPQVNTEDTHLLDPVLQAINTIAGQDADYQQLLTFVTDGFPRQRQDLPLTLQAYWPLRAQLSTDCGLISYQGSRLVIPQAKRRDILRQLHSSHQGIERTKRRAHQTVFWPGLTSDSTNTVTACRSCQEQQASQPAEPLFTEPRPSRPFEDCSADLFSHAGHSYLVYVDRLSGWPTVTVWYRRDPSSKDVIRQLQQRFADTGVPVRLRSDGGPRFKSHDFKQFLTHWGVNHRPSTPEYPQSNGLAEAAVKAMKALISKSTINGHLDDDSYYEGLLEFRNTPRSNGLSPAQILFGRPIRSVVPIHRNGFQLSWQQAFDEIDSKDAELQQATIDYFNQTTRSLSPLTLGTSVRIQNKQTKRWDRTGIVVAIGKYRDYLMKLQTGRVLWRNRRFLRPIPAPAIPPPVPAAPISLVADHPAVSTAESSTLPRRSTRATTATSYYGFNT